MSWLFYTLDLFLSLWIRIQSGSGSETLPVLVTFLSLVSFWTRKHRQFPERTCPERHSPERDNHDRLNISNTKQSRMQLNPERHNPEQFTPNWLNTRVECLELFCDFRKQAICWDQECFYESKSKKSVNLATHVWRMRDKVFTLKNHMDLKNEYFFENLQIPSLNLKRTIAQKIFEI